VIDLAVQLDRQDPRPITTQLADYVRSLIESGRLATGDKLPATRELAGALGIGRNTASQAYQVLIDEGLLLAHVGQGTFVSARGRAGESGGAARAGSARRFAWEGLFARAARPGLPAALRAETGGRVRFDFRGGRVDPEALPRAALRRAYATALRDERARLDTADEPLGHAGLRDQIARLLVSRGIRCGADDVLVTNGAQQAIDLVARVLIDPGDAVAVEQPGYFGAWLGFRAAGARLIGIQVDDRGLRTDVLAREIRTRPVKLVYTTPAAQLPTGAVLDTRRRRALLELADATQTPILEDDYDSEFRFGEPAPPALKTLDSAGQVVYVGTFSKAVMPGLRLGYVVAAPPLLRRLAEARFVATFGADTVAQVAMAELLASGAMERHVRRARRRATERRAVLLEALETSMPEGVTWTEPQGGLAIWLSLPSDLEPAALHAAADQAGLAYTRGETCFFDGRGERHVMLAFATQPPARLREGAAALARAIDQVRRTRRRAS
jgi:GntR family transcriptional regulator/MocR family aminotransferase